MKSTMKKFLAMLLVLSMLACMAACGGESSSDNSTSTANSGTSDTGETSQDTGNAGEVKMSDKDSLTIVSPTTDTGAYSPWPSFTNQASIVVLQVMEPLIEMVSDGTYKNVLAESYEWVDEVTMDVTIRDDVYFHNGDKLTVEDVIFSGNLSKNTSGGAATWAMVDTIEKIDEKTVRYNLKYADNEFLSAISTMITSEKYYNEVGDQGFASHPMGTGYFMWDSYTSGDSVVLKAFISIGVNMEQLKL